MTYPVQLLLSNTSPLAAGNRVLLDTNWPNRATSRPRLVFLAQHDGRYEGGTLEGSSTVAVPRPSRTVQASELQERLAEDGGAADRPLTPTGIAAISTRAGQRYGLEEPADVAGRADSAQQEARRGAEGTSRSEKVVPQRPAREGLPPIRRLTRQKDGGGGKGGGKIAQEPKLRFDGMVGLDQQPGEPLRQRNATPSGVERAQPDEQTGQPQSLRGIDGIDAADLEARREDLRSKASARPPSDGVRGKAGGMGERAREVAGFGNSRSPDRMPPEGRAGRPAGKQRAGMGFGKAREEGVARGAGNGRSAERSAQQPGASRGGLIEKLNMLAAEGKFEDFVRMARDMIPEAKRSTAFSQLVQMVAEKQSLRSAITICSTLEPDGCRYWKELLQFCIDRKNKQGLERAITAMLDNAAVLEECESAAFIEAFKACARLGLDVLADELYEARLAGREKRPNIYVSNALLNALASNSTLAFERFEELLEEGLQPSVVTFNTLLKACMLAHDAEPAGKVLEQLQQRVLKGDEYTFNTLIKIFSYSGDAERALQVKGMMHAAGFELTPSVWGSLLVVCGQAGFLEQAFGFWAEMKAQGVPMTPDCAAALMRACSLAYQGERAIGLLQEMKSEGLQPDLVTYNVAIKACDAPPGIVLSKAQLGVAFELLGDLKAAGLEPNAVTYTALFTLCAHAKCGRRALPASEEMAAAGIKADAKSCTALIAALASEGLVDEALSIFHKMVWGPRRMKPTEVTFRLVTRMCREHGRIEKALQVYQGMRQMGFAPSNAEFRELTRACAEQALKEGQGSSLANKMVEILKLEQRYEVDLHGLSEVEARAVVLCSLLSLQSGYKAGHPIESDLVIITGVGHHSDAAMGPKIREAVLRLLSQELHLLPEATPDNDQPNTAAFMRQEGEGSSLLERPDNKESARHVDRARLGLKEPGKKAPARQQDKASLLAQESALEQRIAATFSSEEPQDDDEGMGTGCGMGVSLAVGGKGAGNPGRLIVPRDVLLRWAAEKGVSGQD